MEIQINDKIYHIKPSDIERFWEKVDFGPGLGPQGECWEWQGATHYKGYGRFGIKHLDNNPRQTDCINAHRFAYALNNKIYNKLIVCHSCDNRCCVNPKHLWLGTEQDNTNDMMLKDRHKYIIKSGEENGSSIINWKIVNEIRTLAGQGISLAEIGRRYNLYRSHVRSICTNEIWKDENFEPIRIGTGKSKPKQYFKKYSQEIVDEVLKLQKLGLKHREISNKLNISNRAVKNYIYKYGK